MQLYRPHPYRHPASLAALVLVLLGVLLAGCSSAPEVQIGTPALTPVSDPQMLVLPDNIIHIAAPPSLGSPQLKLEMTELHALRGSLTSVQRDAVQSWDGTAVVRWNKLARDLVARYKLDPLEASRVYALLSLAQYQTLHAAESNQRQYDRHMPPASESGITPLVSSTAATYPSEHAALAAAAASVLDEFFPNAMPEIDAQRSEEQESRLWAGVNCRSDIVAGDTLGRAIAGTLVARSRDELIALPIWDEKIPSGPGKWQLDPTDPNPPDGVMRSALHPWLMSRVDQFRASPPPAFGSPEFGAALAEVRAISDHRTAEQMRIAKFWVDGVGTATPPGHWNQIAADLITSHKLSLRESVSTFMYLNMAQYDAGLAAWDTKYAYWLIRPWQADPAITLVPKKKPNHPSYVSGHAAFSGAASAVLSAIFPDQATTLAAQAEEAALSRVYGGIHYRFDGVAGLQIGRSVGALAVARWKADAD